MLGEGFGVRGWLLCMLAQAGVSGMEKRSQKGMKDRKGTGRTRVLQGSSWPEVVAHHQSEGLGLLIVR